MVREPSQTGYPSREIVLIGSYQVARSEIASSVTNGKNTRTVTLVLICSMVIHAMLLGFLAWKNAPTVDEVAHLPAGLVIWNDADFSLYRVNPPLVRMIAALPVFLVEHQENTAFYQADADVRYEWAVGREFVKANGTDSYRLFFLARCACIPFSLIGMFVSFHWGKELTSETGGLVAAILWGFSPNVLGHGALITPDIAASSMGLLAAWCFSHWMRSATMRNATFAGLTLGAALLTKSYWIVLLGIWPVLGGIQCYMDRSGCQSRSDLLHLMFILLIGVNVLNLGYFFEGSGTFLGDFRFYSSTLSGELRTPGIDLPGNRFHGTWLGKIPVPLPKDYVTGIDLQKVDFERGTWNYLMGDVKQSEGWFSYYLIGIFLKVPVSTWLLCLLGVTDLVCSAEARFLFRSLVSVLVPAMLIFVIASSQTSLNRHVRYVFPVLPVIYLLCAVGARSRQQLAILLVVLSVCSSLAVYPHSLSYFNFSIGGPERGSKWLIDSNLDWGQDLKEIREWIETHPECRPIYVSWPGDVPLNSLGVDAGLYAGGTPRTGWYFISRHQRNHPLQDYSHFDERIQPLGQIAYTYDIYRIE